MKILEVKPLIFPEVLVIKVGRFPDERGYFTETFRQSDFNSHPQLSFFKDTPFLQANESHSRPNVLRGFHIQHTPPMGKLIRTVHGHMIDWIVDVRQGSANFGKIIGYDMPTTPDKDYFEWIWVAPGFAHGNLFLKETTIEYFVTAEYNPSGEVGINPLSTDLDWSLCNPELIDIFSRSNKEVILSAKDKAGLSLNDFAPISANNS